MAVFLQTKLQNRWYQEKLSLLQCPETLMEISFDVEIHDYWIILILLIVKNQSKTDRVILYSI